MSNALFYSINTLDFVQYPWIYVHNSHAKMFNGNVRRGRGDEGDLNKGNVQK